MRWGLSCIDEGRYSSKILENGVSIGENEFIPTRFRPVYVRHYSKGSIKPKPNLTSSNSSEQETFISIAFNGVAGRGDKCNFPIKNAIVKFTNTITPKSGGHNHFSLDTEIGTGTYVPRTVNDKLDPDTAKTAGTVIEGNTDINGEFFTKYQSGIYGVKETVTIEARRETTSVYPETAVESEPFTYSLDIKVPSLVPLSTNNLDYTLRGSFKLSKKCDDRTHNNSATDRESHYLTNNARTAVTAMAKLYKLNTLGVLSFNDASLEFGGVFDKGTLNRAEKCHVLHRKGTDVDINSQDSKGRDIWFDLYDNGVNGGFGVLFYALEDYADQSGGIREIEGDSIHYKFDQVTSDF